METKSPIEYATVDDVYNFGNAVEALLKSKVAAALEAQKQQVAQNIFTASEEVDLEEEFQPHHELSKELEAHEGKVADVSHHGVLFSFNDPHSAKKFRGVASAKGYDTELAGTTLYVPNNLKSMYKEEFVPHKDHPFHKKSIPELRTIVKHSKNVLEKVKQTNSPAGIDKYEDQYNTASRVLQYKIRKSLAEGKGEEVLEMVSPDFHKAYRNASEKDYDNAVSKSNMAQFKHDNKALSSNIDKAIRRSKGILRSRELENKGYHLNPLSTKIFKNKCKG